MTTFLVALKNDHNGYNLLGKVIHVNRLAVEKKLHTYFPSGTRSYDNILKACRYLLNESSARDVDLVIRDHLNVRVTKVVQRVK